VEVFPVNQLRCNAITMQAGSTSDTLSNLGRTGVDQGLEQEQVTGSGVDGDKKVLTE